MYHYQKNAAASLPNRNLSDLHYDGNLVVDRNAVELVYKHVQRKNDERQLFRNPKISELQTLIAGLGANPTAAEVDAIVEQTNQQRLKEELPALVVCPEEISVTPQLFRDCYDACAKQLARIPTQLDHHNFLEMRIGAEVKNFSALLECFNNSAEQVSDKLQYLKSNAKAATTKKQELDYNEAVSRTVGIARIEALSSNEPLTAEFVGKKLKELHPAIPHEDAQVKQLIKDSLATDGSKSRKPKSKKTRNSKPVAATVHSTTKDEDSLRKIRVERLEKEYFSLARNQRDLIFCPDLDRLASSIGLTASKTKRLLLDINQTRSQQGQSLLLATTPRTADNLRLLLALRMTYHLGSHFSNQEAKQVVAIGTGLKATELNRRIQELSTAYPELVSIITIVRQTRSSLMPRTLEIFDSFFAAGLLMIAAEQGLTRSKLTKAGKSAFTSLRNTALKRTKFDMDNMEHQVLRAQVLALQRCRQQGILGIRAYDQIFERHSTDGSLTAFDLLHDVSFKVEELLQSYELSTFGLKADKRIMLPLIDQHMDSTRYGLRATQLHLRVSSTQYNRLVFANTISKTPEERRQVASLLQQTPPGKESAALLARLHLDRRVVEMWPKTQDVGTPSGDQTVVIDKVEPKINKAQVLEDLQRFAKGNGKVSFTAILKSVGITKYQYDQLCIESANSKSFRDRLMIVDSVKSQLKAKRPLEVALLQFIISKEVYEQWQSARADDMAKYREPDKRQLTSLYNKAIPKGKRLSLLETINNRINNDQPIEQALQQEYIPKALLPWLLSKSIDEMSPQQLSSYYHAITNTQVAQARLFLRPEAKRAMKKLKQQFEQIHTNDMAERREKRKQEFLSNPSELVRSLARVSQKAYLEGQGPELVRSIIDKLGSENVSRVLSLYIRGETDGNSTLHHPINSANHIKVISDILDGNLVALRAIGGDLLAEPGSSERMEVFSYRSEHDLPPTSDFDISRHEQLLKYELDTRQD